jgi:hypothetical protein
VQKDRGHREWAALSHTETWGQKYLLLCKVVNTIFIRKKVCVGLGCPCLHGRIRSNPSKALECSGVQKILPSKSKSGVRHRKFRSKKLATLKKLWEKPQSVFLHVFCHSEHNGEVKNLQKLLWELLPNLSSLTVQHCISNPFSS